MEEKPQSEQDEIELYKANPSMFRNHPFAYILTIFAPVLGIVLAIYLVTKEQPPWVWLSVLVLLVGGGIVTYLTWWLKSKMTTLTVTSMRTKLRTGLLARNITEVWHQDVRNVQLHQGFWHRIMGVGEIGVSSAAQSEIEIKVKGLPDPDRIKKLIDQYRKR